MSNESRKQRTNDELRKVTNRLFYEWKMLEFCAEELQRVPNQLLENVFIESGAIHARNLVKFFYPFESKRKPHETDAIANDFFIESIEWNNICHPIAKTLSYSELGGHADLQIVHIVYEDGNKEPFTTHGHYDWKFTSIADAIQPIFEQFINVIPKNTLGNRWVEKLDEQKGIRWDRLKTIVSEKNDT